MAITLCGARRITFLANVSSDGDPEAVNVLLKLDGEPFHFWQCVNIDGVHGEDRKIRDLHRKRWYQRHRSNWQWVAYYVNDETWSCLSNNRPFPDNSTDTITSNDMQILEDSANKKTVITHKIQRQGIALALQWFERSKKFYKILHIYIWVCEEVSWLILFLINFQISLHKYRINVRFWRIFHSYMSLLDDQSDQLRFVFVSFEVITGRKTLHFFFCISVTWRPLLRRG